MLRKIKHTPTRLDLIFARYDPPFYLVTFNTHRRRKILASPTVHAAFQRYARRAAEFQIWVGRYVIMPDHVHLFVSFGRNCPRSLSEWIKGVKKCVETELRFGGVKVTSWAGQQLRSFWQPGFHDHLLRSDESYAKKVALCSRKSGARRLGRACGGLAIRWRNRFYLPRVKERVCAGDSARYSADSHFSTAFRREGSMESQQLRNCAQDEKTDEDSCGNDDE